MNNKEQFIHRIDEKGNKFYYSDREMKIRRRHDDPAVANAGAVTHYTTGYKAWYLNGLRHRENGPAIEYVDGSKAWYLNDVRLTEAEFNARMNPVELTLDEIAEKFGVSVDKIKIKKG